MARRDRGGCFLALEEGVAPQREMCVGFRASLGAQGRSPSLTEDASRRTGHPSQMQLLSDEVAGTTCLPLGRLPQKRGA